MDEELQALTRLAEEAGELRRLMEEIFKFMSSKEPAVTQAEAAPRFAFVG